MYKNINMWKRKTKGIFNIIEYKRFWDYYDNLNRKIDIIFKAIHNLDDNDISSYIIKTNLLNILVFDYIDGGKNNE